MINWSSTVKGQNRLPNGQPIYPTRRMSMSIYTYVFLLTYLKGRAKLLFRFNFTKKDELNLFRLLTDYQTINCILLDATWCRNLIVLEKVWCKKTIEYKLKWTIQNFPQTYLSYTSCKSTPLEPVQSSLVWHWSSDLKRSEYRRVLSFLESGFRKLQTFKRERSAVLAPTITWRHRLTVQGMYNMTLTTHPGYEKEWFTKVGIILAWKEMLKKEHAKTFSWKATTFHNEVHIELNGATAKMSPKWRGRGQTGVKSPEQEMATKNLFRMVNQSKEDIVRTLIHNMQICMWLFVHKVVQPLMVYLLRKD